MVNVWGGECLGGERLTIVKEHSGEKFAFMTIAIIYSDTISNHASGLLFEFFKCHLMSDTNRSIEII